MEAPGLLLFVFQYPGSSLSTQYQYMIWSPVRYKPQAVAAHGPTHALTMKPQPHCGSHCSRCTLTENHCPNPGTSAVTKAPTCIFSSSSCFSLHQSNHRICHLGTLHLRNRCFWLRRLPVLILVLGSFSVGGVMSILSAPVAGVSSFNT